MKFKITCSALTDIGLIRKGNEDSYTLTNTTAGDVVLAVADGMGGHKGGEVASSIVVDVIEMHFSEKALNATTWDCQEAEAPDFFSTSFLVQVIQKANSKIYHRAQENAEFQGMGTTLTLVMIRGNKALIAQVGDSRAYLIRKNKLSLLTKDHSVVQREIDMGILTPEEALRDPRKNIITKALGITAKIEPDIYEYDLRSDDRLLICSDGLYDLVSEKELLKSSLVGCLESGVKKLVDLAKKYGGKDNITVILAEIMARKEKFSHLSLFSKNVKSKVEAQ